MNKLPILKTIDEAMKVAKKRGIEIPFIILTEDDYKQTGLNRDCSYHNGKIIATYPGGISYIASVEGSAYCIETMKKIKL